jgi:hypothetical protein
MHIIAIVLGSQQEDVMHITGIVLGWTIVAGYLLAASKYLVRLIYRKAIINMPADSSFRRNYQVFMSLIIRSHIYIGLYLLTIIALHFMVELVHHGFFMTGIILSVLMVTQIFLGIYGAFLQGGKRGSWFLAHRILAVVLAAAILTHIWAALSLNRVSN